MPYTHITKRIAVLLSLPLMLAASAQDGNGFSLPHAVQDSVVTVASKEYRPQSFLRRLFMGTNYRSVWEQKVKVPVFHFSGSGFRIKELGGGNS